MKTELKVGIFVLVGLGILLYLSTRVSDGIGTSEDGVIIKARFDSVAGLVAGAEVRAAGVRIGHVVSIRLDTGLKALVEMQLRRGVEQQIPKNSRATIASLGLLGEKYVELKMPDQRNEPAEMITSGLEEGGGGGQGGGNRTDPNVPQVEVQVLEQGDVIEAAPPQGIEELSGLANDIGADVKVVAAELRKAVGEGEDNRVRAILISLEKFSTSLETLVQQNQRGIDRIVGNLDQSTGVVREILSQNQKNIDATIENVRGASERIDRLLAGTKSKSVNWS
jgi:phospholipid/cholesterol/gamma-HCH transport system substrate-binding protein